MSDRKEYKHEYYIKNKQKIKIQRKQWYQENKEAIKKEKKEYYDKNKDYLKNYRIKTKERHKQYCIKNSERLNKLHKKWLSENQDKMYINRKREVEKLCRNINIDPKLLKKMMLSFSSMIKNKTPTCQICGKPNKLEAHHIIHKKFYPKLMFNENNGISLCHFCHQQAHGRKLLLNPFLKR